MHSGRVDDGGPDYYNNYYPWSGPLPPPPHSNNYPPPYNPEPEAAAAIFPPAYHPYGSSQQHNNRPPDGDHFYSGTSSSGAPSIYPPPSQNNLEASGSFHYPHLEDTYPLPSAPSGYSGYSNTPSGHWNAPPEYSNAPSGYFNAPPEYSSAPPEYSNAPPPSYYGYPPLQPNPSFSAHSHAGTFNSGDSYNNLHSASFASHLPPPHLSSSVSFHYPPSPSPLLQPHPPFDSPAASSPQPYYPTSHSGPLSSSGALTNVAPPRPSNGAHVDSTLAILGAKRALRYVLLHGTLDVTISAAKSLPNMDLFSETLRQTLTFIDPSRKTLDKTEERVSNHTSNMITSDPYTCVVLRGATIAKTRVISNNQNPVWDEHFVILVAHQVAEVEFVVKDNDMLGSQFIGRVKIPAELLLRDGIVAGWHDLLGTNGRPCRAGAQIKFALKFMPVEDDPLYMNGVGEGPVYPGVPNTYFPLRRGGRVTLYQDADISERQPDIMLDSGIRYEHRSCWQDICTAILQAHRVIYISGWSVYTKIKLVRQPNRGMPEHAYKNLGELLKFKSQENLRILLLIWDDITSNMFHKQGVMDTHDEETKNFFKHSSVRCVLAPRNPDSKLSWVKQKVVGSIYTHHQKLVIVDTEGPGNLRKLTAFIGGLDLCNGRYDTPDHPLFRTLNTIHKDDVYNSAFTPMAEGGPREPWHDLHCRIDGPAAYDVLTNFEQRWKKVTKWKKLLKSDDYLLDFSRTPGILHPVRATYDNTTTSASLDNYDALRVSEEYDPENWHVQIFRSIDSGSVKGFPKDVLEAEKMNLVCGKNVAIDMSIHSAYVKAIRSAQHFIYIENQYFLGSSFQWPTYKHAGANHLIPIELALKIASKIKAKEHFAVYIVIPMWPDGVPTTNAVQEILYFQGQTMEMMYTIIADALREAEIEHLYHPTDYLNFFCLGSRETNHGNEFVPPNKLPEKTSVQAQAQRNRRFMVYVHAKGMIVDDEYVILGSANINQRSMDGSRDTEIAMGAYQPHYSWARKHGHPRGKVYGYRRSLWEEHIGYWEDSFMEPSSLECVRSVKAIGDNQWKQYTAEKTIDMRGHLLHYPLKVEKNGKVMALPGFEHFPDVGGKILGSSTSLPDDLTT